MKNSIKTGMLIMATLIITGLVASCSKESDTQPVSDGSTERAMIYNFEADELIPDICCGEEIMLHYRIQVNEKPDGDYQVSLNQLSGVGMTTGTAYHGANAQGQVTNGNNGTFHFSTVIAGGGCVTTLKILYHVTVDQQGVPVVVKDVFEIECHGN